MSGIIKCFLFWLRNLDYGFRFSTGVLDCLGILALIGWVVLRYRKRNSKLKPWEDWANKATRRIAFGAFLLSTVVVAPFLQFNEISEAKKNSGQNVISITNDLSLAQDRIYLLDEGKSVDTTINELGRCAVWEYQKSRYANAAHCFELCFKLQESERGSEGWPDEQKSRTWPQYAVSVLKSELQQSDDASSKGEKYNQFRAYLTEMMNNTKNALDTKNQGTWFPLKLNVAIESLKNIEGVAPDVVTNDIEITIQKLREEKTKFHIQ